MTPPLHPRRHLLTGVRGLAIACLAWPVLVVAQATPAAPNDAMLSAPAHLPMLGQRLYREGLRPSGASLTAIGAAQTPLAGKDAACVTCHRRSGFGSTEGRYSVRPIIGPALLQEQTVALHSPRIKARLGTSQRPPYDPLLLARAIRSGLDAAGKPLDPVMPRYVLNDTEMAALSAYLFSLSAQPSPGVDERDIHFATVIQPGVAPERRRAMLDVMQAFFRDKGANVRLDEQRRDAGNMRMYRAYRKWVLHVWDLTGPSEGWGAQLEALYQQQPVFAMVGGLGAASWAPIHEFGERFEIPTVFPQADLPAVSGNGHYSFYLSRGVVLEAEVLARYLRDGGEAGGRVLQVHRRDDAGTAAATALRRSLLEANTAAQGLSVLDMVLEGPPDAAFWSRVQAQGASALVLWLSAADLAGATIAASSTAESAVYLSTTLLAGRAPPATVGPTPRLIYPSDLPPRRDARLLRSRQWLHSKGIPVTDERVQIDTLFALTVVNDVIGHMMDSFSRDYFVERIEHAAGQTPMASSFQTVSLGPDQRFAGKGSSIVQWQESDRKALKPLSGWIVP